MDTANIRIIIEINGHRAYDVLTFNTEDAREAASKIIKQVSKDIETARLVSPIFGAII